MKVTRDKNAFKPITIVIDTEEEATTLWHLLNCAHTQSMKEYLEEWRPRDANVKPSNSLGMWSKFDKEYTP